MNSCDSDKFKRVTDRYEKFYRYADYNSLSDLQKELIVARPGLWFNLHNVYYNIPVCKHPIGTDSLTKFINYLILTEPERVRDFWLNGTFMDFANELLNTPSRYFTNMYINDTDGFVFTGKSADIVNIPDDFEEVETQDSVLRETLHIHPNTPGRVTTWAEFKELNNIADIGAVKRRRSYRRRTPLRRSRRRSRY